MKIIEDISIDGSISRISSISSLILNSKSSFLKTGFCIDYSNIDLHLGGFEMGNNIIIGARPGVGKTALAIELCDRLIYNNRDKNVVILYFSWEMSREQIYYRMLSRLLYMPLLNIKNNYSNIINTKEYEDNKDYINGLNVFIIEGYNDVKSLEYLINNVRERFSQNNTPVDIVCIYDHSRLTISSERNEEQRIFELLSFCNIVKKKGVLNIILSQLNREYEKGLDTKYKDPSNFHLFGADAIQQFSDVTLLLHNPYDYKCYEWECIDSEGNIVNIPTNNKLFVRISKNRNGISNFNLCLSFDKKYQRISNISKSNV